ncbi:MAG: hypothetical protein Q8W44_10575 [Candidatus Palauibacterales bacterium]|nr:hypothetical protein [Candidatus Palauibacterales bacterium]
MRRATSWVLALLVLVSLAGLPACTAEGGDRAGGSDAEATAGAAGSVPEGVPRDTSYAAIGDSARYWARRLLTSLGGPEAWQETRFLRFRWIVGTGEEATGRSHAWDRHTGRYRLEYDRDDGSRVVALFNVNRIRADSLSSAGHVWVDGEPLEGAERDSALTDAYGAFINDSYWLLHPLKYFDPGVHLDWAGRTELSDGRSYPTVHLTFESDLGVTNDQYWGFIDPETGRLHAWQYHLQGREQKGDVIRWEGWQRVGDVRLAPRRVWPDGAVNIHFEDLAAADTVPSGVFSRDGASAPGPPGASN